MTTKPSHQNSLHLNEMDVQTVLKKEGVTIIDVRELYEFEGGHIAGAIHMPLSNFQTYVDKLRGLTGPKVFYCASGNRSGQAVKFLNSLGIKENYNGGSAVMIKNLLLN